MSNPPFHFVVLDILTIFVKKRLGFWFGVPQVCVPPHDQVPCLENDYMHFFYVGREVLSTQSIIAAGM